MPPAFIALALYSEAVSISDAQSNEGKNHIMSVSVQHYAAVAIAALSGFVFLRLVVDKTRYDKRELRKVFFEKIQAVVWFEVFILLTLFVSFIAEAMEFSFILRIFLYIENVFGGLLLIGNVVPFSVLWFCTGVSTRATIIMSEHLYERGKFHDLLIGLCVFVQLNFVIVPLLTLTTARESFIPLLTFGFAMSLAMIASGTIIHRRSPMKSSPKKSK